MKSRLLIHAAALRALTFACKSSSSTSDVPCTCGTPIADIEGCSNPVCLSGKHNPDNPNCVCGPIEIPGKKN